MLLQGNQGQSGKQLGQNITVGLGEFSELLVSELLPPRYELAYRGLSFSASWTAAALAAASTTFGAFILYNPAGSGKNLVLSKVQSVVTAFTPVATGQGWGIFAVPSGAIAPTTTLAAGNTPNNNLVGGPPAQAKTAVSGANTVTATPVLLRLIGGLYPDLAAGDVTALFEADLAGEIIVPPGGLIQISGIGGTPADVTIEVTMSWYELPV